MNIKSAKEPSKRLKSAQEVFRLYRQIEWIDRRIANTETARQTWGKKSADFREILAVRLSEQESKRTQLVRKLAAHQILALKA